MAPTPLPIRLNQTATAAIIWKDATGAVVPAPDGATITVNVPDKATAEANEDFTRLTARPLAPAVGVQVVVRAEGVAGVGILNIADAGVARTVEIIWDPPTPA